jgi:acetyltransferase-like isoleucine patch superfamily enzyme
MKSFFKSLQLIRNDFRKWKTVNFTYPKKRYYERVRSFIPPHLNLKQGTVVEKNVEISSHLCEIGKHVYIANSTFIGFCSKIGNFTSISFGVKIGLREHPLDFVSTSPVFYAKRRGWIKEDIFDEKLKGMVEIGHDVLVSANAVILSGVKIGNGAVIAAGAVVNSDVEPYSVVGGVPARHIKYRFNEEIRKQLAATSWWDWDDDKLKNAKDHFVNPESFLTL